MRTANTQRSFDVPLYNVHLRELYAWRDGVIQPRLEHLERGAHIEFHLDGTTLLIQLWVALLIV